LNLVLVTSGIAADSQRICQHIESPGPVGAKSPAVWSVAADRLLVLGSPTTVSNPRLAATRFIPTRIARRQPSASGAYRALVRALRCASAKIHDSFLQQTEAMSNDQAGVRRGLSTLEALRENEKKIR
jgi:hypothetical protein